MLSPSPTPQVPSYLGGTPPLYGIRLGESNNPTLWTLLPHPVDLAPCLVPGPGCEGLRTLRGCQWLSGVALGWSHSPQFPVNLTGASSLWEIH